jgi:hypothetical protein
LAERTAGRVVELGEDGGVVVLVAEAAEIAREPVLQGSGIDRRRRAADVDRLLAHSPPKWALASR